MYYLVFIHDAQPDLNHTLLKEASTLTEIANMRFMSGDLVVDDKGEIIKDPIWLFNWEKDDPNCYAQQKIRENFHFKVGWTPGISIVAKDYNKPKTGIKTKAHMGFGPNSAVCHNDPYAQPFLTAGIDKCPHCKKGLVE